MSNILPPKFDGALSQRQIFRAVLTAGSAADSHALRWPGGVESDYVLAMDEGESFEQLPIDGVLDLHTFQPRDLGDLVPGYLEECRERGILQVRVVHGKGIGNLKRSVHAILGRLPEVVSFAEAGPHFGGIGATIVNLRPKKQQGRVPPHGRSDNPEQPV